MGIFRVKGEEGGSFFLVPLSENCYPFAKLFQFLFIRAGNCDQEGEKIKLSKQDADLFSRLMWGLQFFVNCEKNIDPDITRTAQ
ncbi:MAG: hypothetical protein D3910_20705 [Candidatus Electrothrix sp. ATG2]|nr:hypothetical protein [Candidatus Electrothrix sp. ATG2]